MMRLLQYNSVTHVVSDHWSLDQVKNCFLRRIQSRAVAALRLLVRKKAVKAPKRCQGATFFPGAFLIFWQKYTL